MRPTIPVIFASNAAHGRRTHDIEESVSAMQAEIEARKQKMEMLAQVAEPHKSRHLHESDVLSTCVAVLLAAPR